MTMNDNEASDSIWFDELLEEMGQRAERRIPLR